MKIGEKDTQQLLYTNVTIFGYIPSFLGLDELKKLKQRITYGKSLDNLLESLYFGIEVTSNSGCWVDGDINTYRTIQISGERWRAHRLSYKLFNGNIVKPFVCHHCDNPSCINFLHLFNGTSEDNTQDAFIKGRMKRHKELTQSERLLLRRHITGIDNIHKPWLNKDKNTESRQTEIKEHKTTLDLKSRLKGLI